jgi:hypothetical protein
VHPHTVTCTAASDPASQPRWASGLPRVQWLQIPLPDRKGSGAVMCTMALDPVSLQERTPERRVSYSFGSCLLVREGFGAPHVLQLRILPSDMGGLLSDARPMILKHKEKPSRSACVARLACSQHTHTYF